MGSLQTGDVIFTNLVYRNNELEHSVAYFYDLYMKSKA